MSKAYELKTVAEAIECIENLSDRIKDLEAEIADLRITCKYFRLGSESRQITLDQHARQALEIVRLQDREEELEAKLETAQPCA